GQAMCPLRAKYGHCDEGDLGRVNEDAGKPKENPYKLFANVHVQFGGHMVQPSNHKPAHCDHVAPTQAEEVLVVATEPEERLADGLAREEATLDVKTEEEDEGRIVVYGSPVAVLRVA
ncbi:hypothetical protein M408DRAFT_13487, partial [Serendipita vermifera MAFF 305830]